MVFPGKCQNDPIYKVASFVVDPTECIRDEARLGVDVDWGDRSRAEGDHHPARPKQRSGFFGRALYILNNMLLRKPLTAIEVLQASKFSVGAGAQPTLPRFPTYGMRHRKWRVFHPAIDDDQDEKW